MKASKLVCVDGIQKFRIETSSFWPDFGPSPGALIVLTTRSGTNRFHCTAFGYLRNDILDANDWFTGHLHLSKPKERQNDFGGKLCAPIVKDQTFLFSSNEGLRVRPGAG